MVKKDISDKDFIVQKIKIEWGNGNVRVVKKNVYRDCNDFYDLTGLNTDQAKCTDLKIYKGTTCLVTKGVIADLDECSTSVCEDCTSCRDFVKTMTEMDYVVLNCRKTENGYEGDIKKLKLIKKRHKIDPNKMKFKKN